jgi:hypothetical protein
MFARILSVGACVIAATGAAGCGNTGSDTGATGDTGTTTGTTATTATIETTERTVVDPSPAAPPQADSTQQWVMPDLVGAVLQQAQDQMQALTGNPAFFTSSHDLGGQDRSQVLDANWKVCSQNVAPGAPVASDTTIDFGVVKLEESCP